MKIRSLALGSVASVALLATGALAADLPVRAPAPAPVVVAPIFTWTGFYIGVNAGYGGDEFTYNEYEGNVTGARDSRYTATYKSRSSGFLGGLQAGYNYQFGGGFVVGLEADYQWANIDGNNSQTFTSNFGAITETYRAGSEVTGFGTVRARLGYAAFANRALFYVTGGWAYGTTKSSLSYNSNYYCCNWGYSKSNSGSGWTLGAGLEYALTNNVTFKTEYLYVDLGSSSLRYDDGKSNLYRANVDTKFHVVRAGLNYKFGWGSAAAPVVARY